MKPCSQPYGVDAQQASRLPAVLKECCCNKGHAQHGENVCQYLSMSPPRQRYPLFPLQSSPRTEAHGLSGIKNLYKFSRTGRDAS